VVMHIRHCTQWPWRWPWLWP